MCACSPIPMPGLIAVSCIVVILSVVHAVAFAVAGMPHCLGILPEGDQYVKYGDSLTLFCTLNRSDPNAEGHSSEDLFFFTDKGGPRIHVESIVLNETTISTVLEDLSLGPHYFYCSLKRNKETDGDVPTSITYVEVGYPPKEVKNFTCVSRNWQNLECEWYPPETYISQTEYTLTYSFSSSMSYSCRESNKTKNKCVLSGDTDSIYRQAREYYKFQLTGKNPLGSKTTSINFHHFAHVIPNKPEHVSIVNKTLGSAVLNWTVPYPMKSFPPGLWSKIEYRSEWDPPGKWSVILLDKPKKGKTWLYNLTGLEYAHTTYDVRIYLKSGAAPVGDSYWSEPGSPRDKFVTPSDIPGKAPSTTFGSFHISTFKANGNDVVIYWNRIPKYMENGDDFGYNITCIRNNKFNCDPPIEKTLTYAKYAISNSNEYMYTIYSVNKVGRSVDSSHVFVPKLDTVPRPESLTSFPYEFGVHELSWRPVHHKNLSNYTIFWCEDQSLPLPCNGVIDWIEVDKSVTAINITTKSAKSIYKFAIAANLKDGSSSGMVWFSCLTLHDKVDKEVKVIVANTDSREVTIVWQIECAQSSSFGGYYIYYCPSPTHSNDCQENHKEQRFLVKEFEKRNTTLRNLKPYTTYRLQMSVMSYNGTQEKHGPRSKPLRFTTLEDAPSEPLHLKKLLATNSSITLAWDLPKETNGVLQEYKLQLVSVSSREELTFNAKDSNDSPIKEHEVEHLLSYTSYNFTLRACTSKKCSKSSSPVVAMTRAGFPGKMPRPHFIHNNNNTAEIRWERPGILAGDLNYYELSESVNGSTEKITNITGLKVEIPLFDCNTTYRIRAVNIDGSVAYKGEWSEPTRSHCGPTVATVWSKHEALVVAICICTFGLITATLFYVVKRGWLHCRRMKDVEVTLPPGLQSQELEKDNQDYVHLDPWPPRPSEGIQGSLEPSIPPDEESLLGKKSEECIDNGTCFNGGVKNGGDSSGCSVGRESLSSSVTSDNHASSDSGAEADQCTNATGVPFMEWDSVKPEQTTLADPNKCRGPVRGRSYSEETQNFGSAWDPSGSTVPGYTRVGFNEGFISDKSLPEKGYVAIGSIAPCNGPESNVNVENYNSVPADNFPLLFEEESGAKPLNNIQTNAAPCYVTLACLQQRMGDGTIAPGDATNNTRSMTRESDKCQSMNDTLLGVGSESSAGDNGKFNSSTGNRMPPYVSMMENPVRDTINECGAEDEEGEAEEKVGVDEGTESICDEGDRGDEGDDGREVKEKCASPLTPDLGTPTKKTVNGIDSALSNKISKDTESYSNYIPHSIFGKESLHTQ